MAGYTDSQTWEAWYESSQVLWENTCLIFVMSVVLSIAAAIVTWRMPSLNGFGNDKITHHSKEDTKEVNVGIPGKVKAAQQRAFQESIKLNEKQKQEEKRAAAEQLAAIHELMQKQGDKFGETTMEDIKNQMKLYSE